MPSMRPDPLKSACAALAALALAAACALHAGTAGAQSVRLLVQSSPLAGFTYHAAPAVFVTLRTGDELALLREADNPHDANAVSVYWRGHKLGYVPRTQNATLAWAMDRGESVVARVSRLQVHRNPRERVEFEVFLQ